MRVDPRPGVNDRRRALRRPLHSVKLGWDDPFRDRTLTFWIKGAFTALVVAPKGTLIPATSPGVLPRPIPQWQATCLSVPDESCPQLPG